MQIIVDNIFEIAVNFLSITIIKLKKKTIDIIQIIDKQFLDYNKKEKKDIY